ncbi:MAG: 50S ribosomal protein L23, partial [Ignavibacteriaceae bacterium]|nr:50S ribosomal protein L23 [Ignavibacteriaceae bacterium]
MHQILISPLITEKMTNITADKGKYGFLVNPNANKIQIAKAIEEKFNVHVT